MVIPVITSLSCHKTGFHFFLFCFFVCFFLFPTEKVTTIDKWNDNHIKFAFFPPGTARSLVIMANPSLHQARSLQARNSLLMPRRFLTGGAISVTVVVQIYPWFKFYLLIVLGKVMYDNEFETMENNI